MSKIKKLSSKNDNISVMSLISLKILSSEPGKDRSFPKERGRIIKN